MFVEIHKKKTRKKSEHGKNDCKYVSDGIRIESLEGI